jgi:hypothetical protein
MERYRRIEVSEANLLKQMNGEGSRQGSRQYNVGRVPDVSHITNNGREQYRDSRSGESRYIPMSQKGQRNIKYNAAGGSRMMNPSAAMRMMYNN